MHRYLHSPTCTKTGTCLGRRNQTRYGILGESDAGFTSLNMHAFSSGLTRTIMTADTFLLGSFPPNLPADTAATLPNNQQVRSCLDAFCHMPLLRDLCGSK